MKINTNNVSLRISAGRVEQFPRDALPQIAFSGRSNVGKSSLLNTLLGRTSLARVSSTPGKTVTVNFYEVDKKLFFVDLPGYGYARRSGDNKRDWSSVTDAYFTANPAHDLLRLVVQLVDMRVGPTRDDMTMIDYLTQTGTPFITVLTKCDKLSQKEAAKALAEITEMLPAGIPVIPFSSVKRTGKDEVWQEISRVTAR